MYVSRRQLEAFGEPLGDMTQRKGRGYICHGGGKGSKAPKAPDYMALAEQTAAAQRVNQYTPYGSLTYSQTGEYGARVNPKTGQPIPGTGKPMYGQTLTLSPEQQALLDQQNRTSLALGNLQDQAAARVAAQQMRGYDDTLLADTNTATQAILNRLQPTLQQQRSGLETQLSNQGLARGTEAYENALRAQNQRENDLYQQAAMQGIDLGMRQRQQGLQEQNYFNTRDINNLNALRSGSQVTTPQFGPTPGGANYSQAGQNQYQAEMDKYNAQQQASSGFLGGLMSLGGTLGGASIIKYSDRRLKENISKVGQLDNGLNVYSYRYKSGGPMHIGVMAQEVMEVNPDAVHIMPDGFMAVDYGAL